MGGRTIGVVHRDPEQRLHGQRLLVRRRRGLLGAAGGHAQAQAQPQRPARAAAERHSTPRFPPEDGAGHGAGHGAGAWRRLGPSQACSPLPGRAPGRGPALGGPHHRWPPRCRARHSAATAAPGSVRGGARRRPGDEGRRWGRRLATGGFRNIKLRGRGGGLARAQWGRATWREGP